MDPTVLPSDLHSCDLEPIRTPGAIQPHGMMLLVDQDSLTIRHGAGDIEGQFGVTQWQSLALQTLIGEDLSLEVAVLVALGDGTGFIGQLRLPAGKILDVSAHLADAHVMVELEPASIPGLSISRAVDRIALVAASFERAPDIAALCRIAAIEFRRLTGFDRVMVYHFLEDDSGEVLAEDCRAGMNSFLHHRFPAADIPRQARELYIRNLLRVIPDIAYKPAPLRPVWPGILPFDMTDSSLRSISPVHLQYLSNMGVRASASFSIVKNGRLWGLVACHNETPRRLTYDIRAACHSLVGSLARQIKSKNEAVAYRQRIRLLGLVEEVMELLSRQGSLAEPLPGGLEAIRDLLDGDGFAVLQGETLLTSGSHPDEAQIRALADWYLARGSEETFATDCLSKIYDTALAYRPSGSGVFIVTLSCVEPWLLLWFRREKVQTIQWAGNPHKPETSLPLTPRASFAAWVETVRGYARPWSPVEQDAGVRFRAALLSLQQNRRVIELNRQLEASLRDKDRLLAQKDFLMGEVHHRVQNSLSLVSSFLGLQSRVAAEPAVQSTLEEARRRLSAVALVHRRLYSGDHLDRVDAARYIQELCAETFSFMGEGWTGHLTLDLAPVLISTDHAVTLGLVLTELLININKYAYGNAAGPVQITLTQDDGRIQLVILDRGAGRKVAPEHSGLGSRIVQGLVEQLGGKLTYSDNQPGLRVTIVLPLSLVANAESDMDTRSSAGM